MFCLNFSICKFTTKSDTFKKKKEKNDVYVKNFILIRSCKYKPTLNHN